MPHYPAYTTTVVGAHSVPRWYEALDRLVTLGQLSPGDIADIRKLAAHTGTLEKAPLVSPIEDFYLTNPIARASAVMAECSAIAEGAATRTAAE